MGSCYYYTPYTRKVQSKNKTPQPKPDKKAMSYEPEKSSPTLGLMNSGVELMGMILDLEKLNLPEDKNYIEAMKAELERRRAARS
jgi:hypothetical protein